MPPPLVRISTPSRQRLSFCQATPKDFAHWLSELPKANIGETARQLYKAILELNELQLSTEERFTFLELIRPEIYTTAHSLERYFLGQSIVLDERPRKVANLCHALHNNLAIGYKMIAHSEAATPLATALQRTLHSVYQILVRSCQLYSPPPEGLWFELHQLYQSACSRKLEQLEVNDPLAQKHSMSCQQAYVAALLLGCAQANQMRQSDIAALAKVLQHWVHRCQLKDAKAPGSLFAIDPLQDNAPRYRSLFSQPLDPRLLGLNTQPLLQALKKHLNQPDDKQAGLFIPTSFSLDLVQHLSATWDEITERSFQRLPSHGELNLCIGMSAVHYFMAGRRSFQDLLHQQDNNQKSVFKPQTKTDVWNLIPQAEVDQWQDEVADNSVQYHNAPATAAAPDTVDAFPTYKLPMINQSPGGYCLLWPGDVPNQLQAGELLGIQDQEQNNWALAAVRWIRLIRGGGTQMGIELISPIAHPCALKLLREGDLASQYLRTLALPAIDAISQPATLITPRVPFQEHNKAQLHLAGVESQVLLSRRLNATASFSHFEYRHLEHKTPPPDVLKVEAKPTGKNPEDDFDSLWTIL